MSKTEPSVVIFDTTLRDGEQSPGATMTRDEKLVIAHALEDMGVNIIEAGFAIASQGDFNTITEIAKNAKSATICSLARSNEKDIQRAYDAIKHAPSHRIHTFIGTSPTHRQYKLKMSEEEILENINKMVRFAKSLCDDIQWSAEDASRTEHDFLCKAIETAISAGATTINLPDTVGYATPQSYKEMFEIVQNQVPNIDKVVLSSHCHNDLGLATANSLAAIEAGAGQVECTINGLGERAGNAALEEIIMALRTRRDQYDIQNSIKTENLTKISRLVSTISGFVVQPNKAIVGANAFAHEAGIHQDGILKNRETYEIMTPESVGLKESTLPLGKHSGRAAVQDRLTRLGVMLDDDKFQNLFKRFKALADQKKHILDEDLYALIYDDQMRDETELSFVSYQLHNESEDVKEGQVILLKDGQEIHSNFKSNGTMDALFKAINQASDFNAELVQYNVHAVTKGTDALAEVTIRMKYKDRTFTAHGRDIDTVAASLKAYTNGINLMMKMEALQEVLEG